MGGAGRSPHEKRCGGGPAGPHGLMPIIRGRHLALLKEPHPASTATVDGIKTRVVDSSCLTDARGKLSPTTLPHRRKDSCSGLSIYNVQICAIIYQIWRKEWGSVGARGRNCWVDHGKRAGYGS